MCVNVGQVCVRRVWAWIRVVRGMPIGSSWQLLLLLRSINRSIHIDWVTRCLICPLIFPADLPCVVLDSEETLFWRSSTFCRRPSHYLSTIEAIYYFCTQLHTVLSEQGRCGPYAGQYDNLLLFFSHTFNTIKTRYDLNWSTIRVHGRTRGSTAGEVPKIVVDGYG